MEHPVDWFTTAEAEATAVLDVRPILAAGRDPFAEVMALAATVPAEGVLVIDAPFDPIPLRRVLAGKDFVSQARRQGPDHWRVCLKRGHFAPVIDAPPALPPRRPGEVWREAEDGGAALHIDVRGLSPPGPLTAVLALVEGGDAATIIVHHDREPILLYAELEERGWECQAHTVGEDGALRFMLRARG